MPRPTVELFVDEEGQVSDIGLFLRDCVVLESPDGQLLPGCRLDIPAAKRLMSGLAQCIAEVRSHSTF